MTQMEKEILIESWSVILKTFPIGSTPQGSGLEMEHFVLLLSFLSIKNSILIPYEDVNRPLSGVYLVCMARKATFLLDANVVGEQLLRFQLRDKVPGNSYSKQL